MLDSVFRCFDKNRQTGGVTSVNLGKILFSSVLVSALLIGVNADAAKKKSSKRASSTQKLSKRSASSKKGLRSVSSKRAAEKEIERQKAEAAAKEKVEAEAAAAKASKSRGGEK